MLSFHFHLAPNCEKNGEIPSSQVHRRWESSVSETSVQCQCWQCWWQYWLVWKCTVWNETLNNSKVQQKLINFITLSLSPFPSKDLCYRCDKSEIATLVEDNNSTTVSCKKYSLAPDRSVIISSAQVSSTAVFAVVLVNEEVCTAERQRTVSDQVTAFVLAVLKKIHSTQKLVYTFLVHFTSQDTVH